MQTCSALHTSVVAVALHTSVVAVALHTSVVAVIILHTSFMCLGPFRQEAPAPPLGTIAIAIAIAILLLLLLSLGTPSGAGAPCRARGGVHPGLRPGWAGPGVGHRAPGGVGTPRRRQPGAPLHDSGSDRASDDTEPYGVCGAYLWELMGGDTTRERPSLS
jgi:uncharacterized protein YggT (Ycf19 family)